VYVWIGEGEPSAPPEIPELAGLTGFTAIQGACTFDANWQLGVAISMDTIHTGFVHGAHFCSPKEAPSAPVKNECFFGVFNFGGAEHIYRVSTRETGQTVIVENDPTKLVVHFDLPGRIIALFKDHITQEGDTPHPTIIVLQFVPLGPDTARMEFLIGPTGVGDGVYWTPDVPDILGEDLVQIASVQRNLKDGDQFGFVEADSSIASALRIILLAHEGKWEQMRTGQLGRIREVHVRS
jgi:hypothetical protein